MTAQREPKVLVRGGLVLTAIVVAAIAVRAVFLAELVHSDIGTVQSVDTRFYDEIARSLAAGGRLPPGALTFNPLYPFFLAFVYRAFGAGDIAPRVAQSALGVLTIVLVYFAGRRIVAGPRSGRPDRAATAGLAGAMALVYAPLVLHEGVLLGTTVETALLAAAFLLALAVDQALSGGRRASAGGRGAPTWFLALVLGVCVGVGALGRPNLFLLLAAGLTPWLALRSRRRLRGAAVAAAFAAGVAVALMPPLLYNTRETGRFVPMTAHGGLNFYIGNRTGATGVFDPPAGMRSDMRGLIEDSRWNAERETGRTLGDAEVSDYYFRRALSDIRNDPGAWALLLGRKLALFMNRVEFRDVPSVFFVQKSCAILRFLFLPYAAIAPLAVGGLIALWRSGRSRGVTAIFLAAAVLSVMLFFVNARYRLPAVPVLLVLAAFFLAWGRREVSRRRIRPLLVAGIPALAAFLFVSAPRMIEMNPSAAYTVLGNHYIDRGEEGKAAEAFAEAYRLDPERPEAMVNYARVLMRKGEPAEAAALYGRAYARNPRIPRLAIEYGVALEGAGRRDEAKRLYEEGLSAPRVAERVLACRLLAQAALADGDREKAIGLIRRAIEMAPGDEELAGMLQWLQSGE